MMPVGEAGGGSGMLKGAVLRHTPHSSVWSDSSLDSFTPAE